jgi:hypothetical protein
VFPVFACLFLFAASLLAQPTIVRIEVFGSAAKNPERILKALKIAVGDRLPGGRIELEQRISKLDDVSAASVEAFCCEGLNRVVLYVGVQARGKASIDYQIPGNPDLRLPQPVIDGYGRLVEALATIPYGARVETNYSLGYPISSNPEVLAAQTEFVSLARDHQSVLAKVLLESNDAEQRAAAAYVLCYAPRSQTLVDQLQTAIRDHDAIVRRNVMRALVAMGVAAQNDSSIKVRPVWLVEFLSSIVLSDRLDALDALVDLTDPNVIKTPNQDTLTLLKERAQKELEAMSKWRHQDHALPAFILLGRVQGWTEQQTQEAWAKRS